MAQNPQSLSQRGLVVTGSEEVCKPVLVSSLGNMCWKIARAMAKPLNGPFLCGAPCSEPQGSFLAAVDAEKTALVADMIRIVQTIPAASLASS